MDWNHLPGELKSRVLGYLDTPSLGQMAQVNRESLKLSSALIGKRLVDLASDVMEKDYGKQATMLDRLLFRGDDRNPKHIFSTGFLRKPGTPTLHQRGQLRGYTEGVISTTKKFKQALSYYNGDETTNVGYVYVVDPSALGGYDLEGHNDQEEVAYYYIPPESILGAIGKIEGPTVSFWTFLSYFCCCGCCRKSAKPRYKLVEEDFIINARYAGKQDVEEILANLASDELFCPRAKETRLKQE